MAPSARHLIAGATVVLAVAGCATTQDEAARLQINSARLRAAELPVRIAQSDPGVRVMTTAVVSGTGGAAVVVRLRNLLARPVSDLALLVGYSQRGKRSTYLNRAAGLDYFQTHVPAIAAHGDLTWVFTTQRRLPAGATAFAQVGEPSAAAPALPATLPSLGIVQAGSSQVTVKNPTGVPQYQLQVYGVAQRRGRYVAAAHASIEHLGTGSSRAIRLAPVGSAAGSRLSLEVPPTIFK